MSNAQPDSDGDKNKRKEKIRMPSYDPGCKPIAIEYSPALAFSSDTGESEPDLFARSTSLRNSGSMDSIPIKGKNALQVFGDKINKRRSKGMDGLKSS